MAEGPDIARIAALIGEPARANMLVALMRGGALTLSELASEAGVGLSTASSHAARLADGGLIRVRAAGRHRYMEIASPAVAALVEGIMALSVRDEPMRRRPGPRDPALRAARICYDHLAGESGVQLYDSLIGRGLLEQGPHGLDLSRRGRDFMRDVGLPHDALRPGRPPLCRECLDWSLRRSHLAGRLGRALFAAMEARCWLRRMPGSRVVAFSREGRAEFDRAFPRQRADESLDLPRVSP